MHSTRPTWASTGLLWQVLGSQASTRCGVSIPRDDKRLVQVVEELQGEANGHCAELKVVSIPDDVSWVIANANGSEHVSEQHRIWT